MKKKTFTVDDLTLEVREPQVKHINAAKVISNKVFAEAMESGALLRDQLEASLKQRNKWTETQDEEFATLAAEIKELRAKIKAGGVKTSQGREWSIDVIRKEAQLNALVAHKLDLDAMTVEGQAQNAYFNKLVSCCVYQDNRLYFKTMEDYLSAASTPVGLRCAQELYSILLDVEARDEDLPEIKFLKRFNFTDEDGRFIDQEGHLVDVEGRRIDDDGFLINDAGERIDGDGNLVRPEAPIEESPWLDDDGAPIVELQPETDTSDASAGEPVSESVSEGV